MINKLREIAKGLKIYIPALFLALKRKDTPIVAKILSLITVGYALSPIDLIPDFIPVLGYLDDLILLPLLVSLTIRTIPKPILEECLIRSKNLWVDKKPKKWYYAIPILLFWSVIIGYIFYRFSR